MKSLKIGIVGSGAVGGVISALLSEKGYDVELAKRFDSDIVLDNYVGLEITGKFGNKNILVKSVNGMENFTSKKDVIFVLTKAFDAPGVTKKCLTHLKSSGIIVSSQNVMNIEEMSKVVGKDRLIAMIINWSAVRHNKGLMEVTAPGNILIGNFSPSSSVFLQPVRQMLSCICQVDISNDVTADIWSRVVINSCISSMGALTGYKLSKFIDLKPSKKIMYQIISEAIALSKYKQVKIKNYGGLNYYKYISSGLSNWLYRRRVITMLKRQNGNIVSSVMRDIENNKQSEIYYLNGYFNRLGKLYGVKTPVNSRMYEMVNEVAQGKRRMNIGNLQDQYLISNKKITIKR